jgi:uncharacterized damage-inducible protein DinB
MIMSVPQTMAEIFARIERAMQRVVQAITPLSPAHMLEPRLPNGQSVKDVLAHLTWWDQWLLFTLPADQNTVRTPITPPLVDQIPLADHWADEMNAKVYAHNQSRELSTIQAEFTATCSQLLQRVSQLSIDDLYDPDGMAAMIGQPIAPLVLGIYEHYEEHAHDLEQLNR